MKETEGIYFTYHSGALAGNTMSMRNTSFILDDYPGDNRLLALHITVS